MSDPHDLAAVSARFVKAYDLATRDAAPVRAILERCTIQVLEKNAVLFREREHGDVMYFLLAGRIRVGRLDTRGASQRVAVIEAPSILGHMGLVENAPRTTTCSARVPSTVAALSGAAFRALLGDPGPSGTAMRHILLSSLTQQLVDSNTRLRALIDPTNVLPTDETTEHGMATAGDALQGWRPNGPRR
jgi:CRP-like cAMP-binding protein